MLDPPPPNPSSQSIEELKPADEWICTCMFTRPSFITGLLAGVLLAFLLHHLLQGDTIPKQIPELASVPAGQTSQQTIMGYLKRDGMSASIYESFHRAWAEGGDLAISEVDDKSESKAHVKVSGLDHIFNPSATPVHGLFTGEFTREVLVPNRYGILNLESAVFLPTDPSLYQFYIPAESTPDDLPKVK
jgi:hypothetical protein